MQGLYQFVSKVEDERRRAVAEMHRLDNAQFHNLAAAQRARAHVLFEVLAWAGFDGCDVIQRDSYGAWDA